MIIMKLITIHVNNCAKKFRARSPELFCAIILLYGRYPEYVAVIYISIKQLIYNKISAEQIKDGFWFRFFPGYRLWLSEVK